MPKGIAGCGGRVGIQVLSTWWCSPQGLRNIVTNKCYYPSSRFTASIFTKHGSELEVYFSTRPAPRLQYLDPHRPVQSCPDLDPPHPATTKLRPIRAWVPAPQKILTRPASNSGMDSMDVRSIKVLSHRTILYWRAMAAEDWKRRSVLKSCAISRTVPALDKSLEGQFADQKHGIDFW